MNTRCPRNVHEVLWKLTTGSSKLPVEVEEGRGVRERVLEEEASEITWE